MQLSGGILPASCQQQPQKNGRSMQHTLATASKEPADMIASLKTSAFLSIICSYMCRQIPSPFDVEPAGLPPEWS